MIDSKYRFSLDVNSTVSNVRLKCKRGDTGRSIYVALTESGYPYHITDDCYAVFTATKPDGKKVYNGCRIDGCVIIYELTPQTVAVPGLVKCEIKLYGADDKLITSASFLLEVYNAQVNDGDDLESENEVEALTHLVSQATGIIVKLETVPNFGAGAKVGNYLMVSEIDENERMVNVIPVDAPSGGNGSDSSHLTGVVKTVNGKAPDESGNVEIPACGGDMGFVIDGETLVIAENSTTIIENETLIL